MTDVKFELLQMELFYYLTVCKQITYVELKVWCYITIIETI